MDSLTRVASGDVRSTPQSRPFLGQALRSTNDPKQTLAEEIDGEEKAIGEVCLDGGKNDRMAFQARVY